MPPSDLAIALNYYTPYVSGLTNYARDVAEGLAARGLAVTVVTTAFRPGLPDEEVINGVRVLRAPVLASVGKGVVSPAFLTLARRTFAEAKVVNLHLPMLEAGVLARLVKGPLVVTYHCDVSLPPGILDWAQQVTVDRSSRAALRRANTIAVTSLDYARHSRLSNLLSGSKVTEIPPPCLTRQEGQPTYRDGNGFHVGCLGRIVTEKGIEYLVEGFLALDDAGARLLIGGDFNEVAGGSVIDRVRQQIAGDSRIQILGFVPDERLADLYASLDTFALTSVNSFEAFGIVQVEAMLAGVPVLATDLPGVRVPIQQTGFGVIVAPSNGPAIARGLSALRDTPPDRTSGRLAAHDRFSIERVLDDYEDLVRRLAEENHAMGLENVSKQWNELGERDPLWAVLTDAGKDGGRWDTEQFLSTGKAEIAELMLTLSQRGVDPALDSALDFGCGAGRLTQGLVDAGFQHATGVDISVGMLDKARSLNRHAERCTFVHNDSDRLGPVADGAVDLVYSCRVLQHMPSPLAHGYIKDFFRVVRPGGVVVFQIPERPAPGLVGTALRVAPRPILNRLRKGMEMHGTSPTRVRELVSQAGGHVVAVLDDRAAGHRWVSHTYICRAGA